MPNEIINKRGPLDDAEWAIMRRHTIEGETMLARVGGLLGRVGSIVRASHEHFDGSGYPDGLAGEEIPLAARIVACCDAFSAMTTDRSYRKALTLEAAAVELRRVAGTQFDPGSSTPAARRRTRRRRRERAREAGARRVARGGTGLERADSVDPDAGPVTPARLVAEQGPVPRVLALQDLGELGDADRRVRDPSCPSSAR